MFPATTDAILASLNILPVRTVVVVFPLVPVIATTGRRTEPAGDFKFAHDADPLRERFPHERGGGRNSGAHDDGLCVKHPAGVDPEFVRNTYGVERGGRRPHFFRRRAVAQKHRRPPGGKKPRHRKTAARPPEDAVPETARQ